MERLRLPLNEVQISLLHRFKPKLLNSVHHCCIALSHQMYMSVLEFGKLLHEVEKVIAIDDIYRAVLNRLNIVDGGCLVFQTVQVGKPPILKSEMSYAFVQVFVHSIIAKAALFHIGHSFANFTFVQNVFFSLYVKPGKMP